MKKFTNFLRGHVLIIIFRSPHAIYIITKLKILKLDDIAVLITGLTNRKFSQICKIFDDFEKASGLKVNLSKTVIVPLSGAVTEVDKAIVDNDIWPEFCTQFRDHEKYLGILLGPKVTDNDILRPIVDTMTARILEWTNYLSTLKPSLATKMDIANEISSIFGYVTQTLILPDNRTRVAGSIRRDMMKFLIGFDWMSQDVLFSLPAILDIPPGKSVRDPHLWSVATVLRATMGYEFDDSIEHRRSIGKVASNARNIFHRLTGSHFDEVIIPPGSSPQSYFFSLLIKNSDHTTAKNDVIRQTATNFAISNDEATRLIEGLQCVKKQKSPISYHQMYTFFAVCMIGSPTRTRMRFFECMRHQQSYRCRLCGQHDGDHIHHWFRAAERCPSVTAAATMVGTELDFSSADEIELNILLVCAVLHAVSKVPATSSLHSVDPDGSVVASWFVHLRTGAPPRPIDLPKHTSSGYTLLYEQHFHEITNVSDAGIYHSGGPSPAPITYWRRPGFIQIFIALNLDKEEDNTVAHVGAVILGITSRPIVITIPDAAVGDETAHIIMSTAVVNTIGATLGGPYRTDSQDGRIQVVLREQNVSYFLRNQFRPSKNDSSARAEHLVRGSLRQLEKRLNVDFKFTSLKPAGVQVGWFPEALRASKDARSGARAIPIILDADRGWDDAQLQRIRSRLSG